MYKSEDTRGISNANIAWKIIICKQLIWSCTTRQYQFAVQ